MKPTIKDFIELQTKYKENKELFDKEKKIEGNRGREDGYVAEDLVIRTLGWTKYNNTNHKEIDADAGSILGLVDIKTGSAKKYEDKFCLEVIQNPKTSIKEQSIFAGVSDWATNMHINNLAYLDLSDDDFPLYIFSVDKLKEVFAINEILNNLNMDHMDYYVRSWSWNGWLETPRYAYNAPAKFWCFGKSALGFGLPIDLASNKIILKDLLGDKDAESRDKSSDGNNRTNKRKTSNSLSDNKK